MSSSVSSASLVNSTLSTVPMCSCGKEAVLRISNTPRNPGRAFFGCPIYNKEGLPHCKYFKWADGSEYKEQALVKREAEILRKEKELKKREEEIGKRELAHHNDEAQLRKREEEIDKRELALHNNEAHLRRQEAEMRHARTLLRGQWLMSIVLYLYLIRSK